MTNTAFQGKFDHIYIDLDEIFKLPISYKGEDKFKLERERDDILERIYDGRIRNIKVNGRLFGIEQ